ncbi:hypothetical protein WR25_06362 [Diploscapter pachys]|uniref:Uncharacterized protein n=1 Tax=Diploscapter pachys TaxID=2018661 RepID=A0A2A2KMA5_9BILA|nr:hypothetical protein WR25_06362 [Diploscapter pachys]
MCFKSTVFVDFKAVGEEKMTTKGKEFQSTSRTTAFLGLIGLIGLSEGKIGGFLCLSSVSSTISASKA